MNRIALQCNRLFLPVELSTKIGIIPPLESCINKKIIDENISTSSSSNEFAKNSDNDSTSMGGLVLVYEESKEVTTEANRYGVIGVMAYASQPWWRAVGDG